MFFTGKKVSAPKKVGAHSIVDANKRAREERQKEKARIASIIFIQSFIRQRRDIKRISSDLRAHLLLENPHHTFDDSDDPQSWLMRCFREFLFVCENSSFDQLLASKASTYLNKDYLLIINNDKLYYQWQNQIERLLKLYSRHFSTCARFSDFLMIITSESDFLQNIPSDKKKDINIDRVKQLVDYISRSMMKEINVFAQFLIDSQNWSSNPTETLSILKIYLNILENTYIKPSRDLKDDSMPTLDMNDLKNLRDFVNFLFNDLHSSIFADSSISSRILNTNIHALKLLSENNQEDPVSPITSKNFVSVSKFLINEMKLYDSSFDHNHLDPNVKSSIGFESVSISDQNSGLVPKSGFDLKAASLESFASSISLKLEEFHLFSNRYRIELEQIEDHLDSTDVDDFEEKTAKNRFDFETLNFTLSSISSTTETIFSESKLSILVNRICLGKESNKEKLEGFENISKLVSRLKTVSRISTSALLSLASPLIPLWDTLKSTYYNISSSGSLEIDKRSDLFSLFCESYSFLLATQITDDKFFIDQVPLNLDQNREMIAFFKQIILNRVNQVFSRSLPNSFISLMKSFNSLLRQFRIRNNIRTWSKTDDFLIPSLKSQNLFGPEYAHHYIALYCPLLIPMLEKVKLFNEWLRVDKMHHQADDSDWTPSNAIQLLIRRGPHLLADSYQKLNPLHSKLKQKIKVQFVSEEGVPEAGIDGGGLFRELFSEIIKLAFSPDFGLFKATSQHFLYPNPHSSELVDDSLKKFVFLGQILGKCIYEMLLVDLPLAPFFLNKMLGYTNTIRDLLSYDEAIYHGMQKLMDLKEIESLDQVFVSSTTTVSGETKDIELKKGGANIKVDSNNVIEYVQLIVDTKLNAPIQAQSQAFLRGLSQVIELNWLKLFMEDELLLVICGGGRLDVQDLKENVEYGGGFHEYHPTIQILWEVLEEFTSEEQQAFLKFVTSVGRPPILGFGTLHPKLCIRLSKTDTSFLPSANTCLNLLKLPAYPTKQMMIEKLKYAINSGARFELS